jgi:hypothetical protein
MTREWEESDTGPSAEEMMAFADGELPPGRAREVAAWLAGHPDAGREVEEHRLLRDLWQRATPPEPSPRAWERSLRRVENASVVPRRAGSGRRFWPLWLAAAAAAVLTLTLVRRPDVPPKPAAPAATPADDEPFPVAEAREVDILSMDTRDADYLIGHPPVLADLKFVSPQDVKDVRVDPRPGGWGARLEAGEVPMVVALPASEGRKP